MEASLILGSPAGLEPRPTRPTDVPALEEYASPRFFSILANPYRETYWAVLVRAYQRKFYAHGVALTRPEAIDLAEGVMEEAFALGIDPAKIEWEEGWDLPALEDDIPHQSPLRESARRLIRMLEAAGWFYFQTYPDQIYPVLEFTQVGQRMINHMVRDMRGERLPLRSFADRLGELVGNKCERMRLAPGRLRQLRDVVGQLNERIHELLSGIKKQSKDVVSRAPTVRAILKDLLIDFEKHVGADYALLKRRESPPRLWAAVNQAVYDLREDALWLHREAEWYREESGLEDADEAMHRVLWDLDWILQVMDSLSRANDLLDQRYSRYVSLARRRVQAQIRQSFNLADSIQALLEASAAGHLPLRPVMLPKVVTIAPVGFSFQRKKRANATPEPVEEISDLSESEARKHRAQMDDAIPLAEVRRWLGGTDDFTVQAAVDALPLEGMQDYLCHIFASAYAIEGKGGIEFEADTCASGPGDCLKPDKCSVCFRRHNGFRVPRGTFTVHAVSGRTS